MAFPRLVRNAVPILLLACGLPAQQSVLEGVAANAITHEPLAGVHVRLVGIRDLMQNTFDSYGAISDRAGRFSIGSLKPGSYIMLPVFPGFVFARPKDGPLPFPSITLKAGEHIPDFKLDMTPEGVLVGRVLDDYGDPLENARVQLESVSNDFVVASPNLTETAPAAQTDDRGIYRIACLPGKYRVKATWNGTGQVEVRTDGSAPNDYAATYFPNAPGKDAAVVVESQPAAETTAIDIRMGHSARHQVFSINGTVAGPVDDAAPTSVVLISRNGSNVWSRSTVVRDRRFSFARLEPGTYQLYAISGTQGPLVEVKLDAADAAVELRLTGGGDLTGVVEIAGEPRGTPQEKRTVRLKSSGQFGSFGPTPSAEVDREGLFHVTAVSPGRFEVQVTPLPENAYIKSVEVDGKAGDGATVELNGTPGAHARIVVSRAGAELSGQIRSKDGAPLVNSVAIVALIDNVEKLNLDNSDESHVARVAGDGKYSFHGVRPGKYRILAIDAFHAPEIDKLEVAKKLVAGLPEFEIKEGDRITKDVTVVGKEDADAK